MKRHQIILFSMLAVMWIYSCGGGGSSNASNETADPSIDTSLSDPDLGISSGDLASDLLQTINLTTQNLAESFPLVLEGGIGKIKYQAATSSRFTTTLSDWTIRCSDTTRINLSGILQSDNEDVFQLSASLDFVNCNDLNGGIETETEYTKGLNQDEYQTTITGQITGSGCVVDFNEFKMTVLENKTSETQTFIYYGTQKATCSNKTVTCSFGAGTSSETAYNLCSD